MPPAPLLRAGAQCPPMSVAARGRPGLAGVQGGGPIAAPGLSAPALQTEPGSGPGALGAGRGRSTGPAHWQLCAPFPRSREMVRRCGGRAESLGKRRKGKRRRRLERMRKGQLIWGPGWDAPGAGFCAVGSLERTAHGAEMARLARGGRLGAPRAPLPCSDRPRVRRRHERHCSPGEGQSGQRPGKEGRGGGGAALAPGSAPAPADSQPSFFPSPAPGPGRRGGGCSPLCNRGVKKCEKRALCYLFGSRKFMPS